MSCRSVGRAQFRVDQFAKLVLVAPAGLYDPAHPTVDILAVPPPQVPPMLVSDFEVLKPHLPSSPDFDFVAQRYREMTTVARLLWERPWDKKMSRYLHRITVPTLGIWGEQDRLVPAQQAQTWRELLPHAKVKVFAGAGHLVLDEAPDSVTAIQEFLG
ncbi:MAG: alpha/beta fold hydrolase [Pigmentiphaga sp.]